MRITLSVIKADIASIGGHIKPSKDLVQAVKDYVTEKGESLVRSLYVGHTGDDIAILMSHTHGVGAGEVHKLTWGAFVAGTEVAKRQGLYGAQVRIC